MTSDDTWTFRPIKREMIINMVLFLPMTIGGIVLMFAGQPISGAILIVATLGMLFFGTRETVTGRYTVSPQGIAFDEWGRHEYLEWDQIDDFTIEGVGFGRAKLYDHRWVFTGRDAEGRRRKVRVGVALMRESDVDEMKALVDKRLKKAGRIA